MDFLQYRPSPHFAAKVETLLMTGVDAIVADFDRTITESSSPASF
ncbi:MAG TPA: hypothetical protein PK765_07635 [bacterium]|nr:hypothetical protein [bacterium]